MTRNKIKKIFGTDGVRGRANYAPMTVETAMALGRAIGKIFRKREGKHRVVIGKDTRLSCYMFENALISGLCSMGIDTLMVGPLPTPGIAFITRAYRADAGIVISASHNPYYDNGIKFFSSEGYKFSQEVEAQIEELVFEGQFDDCLPNDSDIGKNTKIDDANGRYIEFAKNTFPKNRSLLGMKIALDCANGAGYRVAPMIFRELDAEVFVIGDRPNGININQSCGSLHLEPLRRLVLESGAHVGIALDGDADRLIMIDENGNVIDGDLILAISAKYLLQNGLLKNNKVVTTVMCNLGFIQAMEELGIEVVQTQVGDRFVIQKMLQENLNLGGEQSGHIIFSDHNTTGDGLVSALQILKIMVSEHKALSELASVVQKFPQVCLSIPIVSKPELKTLSTLQRSIFDAEELLGNKGRVLVRYSGTENICRVMVEGKDLIQVNGIAEQIASAVRVEIGS